MEATLTALADPHRREIVELLLARGEQPMGAIASRLPIAQSGVSRHLRVLREAGLVTSRAQGQQRLYAARPEPLMELERWLAQYRCVWEHQLDSLGEALARRARAKKP